MKKSVLILFLLTILVIKAEGQTVLTDTIIINDTSKIITKYDMISIVTTTICGSDTSIIIDNIKYYSTIMDSLKATDTYLNRDTISNKIDYLYLHLAHASGCYGVGFSHLYFYYDTNLVSNHKGIIFYIDYQRRVKIFRCFDKDILDSILKILNNNMAFNINGFGYDLLPKDRFYTSGVYRYKIWIKTKYHDRILENVFDVYPSTHFGFGNNVLNFLWEFESKNITEFDTINFNKFSNDNVNYINEHSLIKDMITIFKNTEISNIPF